MSSNSSYKARQFNLSNLKGISDETLEVHFKLYEGYVKETNNLTERISEFIKDGNVDQDEMPAYSELTRRLGFEYNGMVLHEYYFDNLESGGGKGDPDKSAQFTKAAEATFGSYEIWKTDFVGIGKMRGVGWAICYQNPANGRISNHWITLHETGNVAGFNPILVMDFGDISENSVAFAPDTLRVGLRAGEPSSRDTCFCGASAVVGAGSFFPTIGSAGGLIDPDSACFGGGAKPRRS